MAADPQPVLTPLERAALLEDIVDELIPGDANWPSASSVGVQGLVVYRLLEQGLDDVIEDVVAALNDAGGPLGDKPAEARVRIMEEFANAKPKLFDRLREVAYLAYYESPFVGDVIRQMGRPYAKRPHMTGYPSKRFDPGKDTPTHKRGHHVPTEAVVPLDISELHLDENRTERWGLDR